MGTTGESNSQYANNSICPVKLPTLQGIFQIQCKHHRRNTIITVLIYQKAKAVTSSAARRRAWMNNTIVKSVCSNVTPEFANDSYKTKQYLYSISIVYLTPYLRCGWRPSLLGPERLQRPTWISWCDDVWAGSRAECLQGRESSLLSSDHWNSPLMQPWPEVSSWGCFSPPP